MVTPLYRRVFPLPKEATGPKWTGLGPYFWNVITAAAMTTPTATSRTARAHGVSAGQEK